MAATSLPYPHLCQHTTASLEFLSDDALFAACGVRVAFTGRRGGVSTGAYESLNLGDHVADDFDDVGANRLKLQHIFDIEKFPLIIPKQIHGTNVVEIQSVTIEDLARAQDRARAGADAVVVTVPQVAALLCFADCVPVIIVSPEGYFAVIHAGWRGVLSSIAIKALHRLIGCNVTSQEDVRMRAAGCNVYIGPYIHAECFETKTDVRQQFMHTFGAECIKDDRHIDLGRALVLDLLHAGIDPDRIEDAHICTVCSSDRYYSYRASGGLCGRHGALAFAKRDESYGN